MAESNLGYLHSTNSDENIKLLPPKKRSYAYMAVSDSLRSTKSDENNKLLPPKKRSCAYMLSSQLPETSPASNQHQVNAKQLSYVTSNRKTTRKLILNIPPPGDDKLRLLLDHIRNNINYNDVRDVKIIMENKELTDTDAKDKQARLSIPAKQILALFLTKEEELLLQQKVGRNKKAKIDVKVIIESSQYDMRLSRWDYHSNNNNNEPGWKYVLAHGWPQLRKEHNLEVDDIIRLVSFRFNKVTISFT